VSLKDKKGQDMYVCDNLEFTLIQPSHEGGSVFAPTKIVQRFERNIHYQLTAKEVGVGKLCFRLKPLKFGELTFTPTPELESCKLIRVTTKVTYPMKGNLLLPHTGHVKHHTYNLYAEGGSGRGYKFTSRNPDAAVAKTEVENAQFGIVTSVGVGETIIVACDIVNPSNCAEKLCEVARPTDLKYLPDQKEVLIGNQLVLEFIVLGPEARMFTVVSGIELEAEIQDPFFTVSSITKYSSEYNSWRVELFSREPGITFVSVGIASVGTKLPFQDVKIAGYAPVTVVPSNILITVNTPRTFVHSGGPLSWDPARDSVAVLQLEDQQHLGFDQGLTSQYNILCTDVHEQEVILAVHSPPTTELPKPHAAQTSLSVKCVPQLVVEDNIYLGVGEHKPLVLPLWLENEPSLMDLLLFEIGDEGIVELEVGEDGVNTLVGERLGSTTLHIRVNHPSLKDLPQELDGLHALIKVHVEFQGFTVVTGAYDLLEGNWVQAYVKGSNNEMPDSINFEIGGVEVAWSTESLNVIEIHPALENRNFTQVVGFQKVIGPSIRYHGKARGEARIDVIIRVTKFQQRIFEETLIINVLSLPPSQVLVVPPAARVDLMPKIQQRNEVALLLPTTQSIGDQITIDESNLIRTDGIKSPLDKSILATFSQQEYHNSSIAFVVSVREPKGLLLVPDRRLDGSGMIIGDRILVKVFLHDIIGRRFSSVKGWASSTFLQYSSSNMAAVGVEMINKGNVDNGIIGTLAFSAVGEGKAVVGVGVEGCPELQTFIEVWTHHRESGHPIIKVLVKIIPNVLFDNFQGLQAAIMIQTLIADGLDVTKSRLVIEKIDLRKAELYFRIIEGEKTGISIYVLAEKFTELFWKRGQSWGFDFSNPPKLGKMTLGIGEDPTVFDFVFINKDGKKSQQLEEQFIRPMEKTVRSHQLPSRTKIKSRPLSSNTSSSEGYYDGALSTSGIKTASVVVAILTTLYYLRRFFGFGPRRQDTTVAVVEEDDNLEFYNKELHMRTIQQNYL